MPHLSHVHPIFDWFLHILSLAFETTTLDIHQDSRLVELRDAVIGDKAGKALRDGVTISFNPATKSLAFQCTSFETARELREAIGDGMIKGQTLIVLVPQEHCTAT